MSFQISKIVGRVVGLWRYPVKSMGPETLSVVDVSWHGFSGDRRWAFIRDEASQSGFPWLTLRERSDLCRYSAAFTDPTSPDNSPTVIRTPTGVTFDVTDANLATELYPSGTRVVRQDRGTFDTFPLSLISTQSIVQIEKAIGAELNVQRFRPNILIEATCDSLFPEDEWVGSVLRIGGMRMRVDKRDGRCVVISIDPDTAIRSPEILRAVASDRKGFLGVYGTTVEPGPISLNDSVFLD